MICVDADKLERGIREYTDGNGEIIGMFLTDFHLLLEECAIKRRSIRPSDNLTEVVRCKDCKWFEKWYKELPSYDTGFYCTRPNQQSANLLPTDYCSYGVKRNE